MDSAKSQHRSLAQFLVDEGIIKRSDYEKALKLQWEKGGSIEEKLIELGCITEDKLIKLLHKYFGIYYLDLSRLEIDPDAASHIPSRIAWNYKLVAVRKTKNSLAVAMANPLDEVALEELKKVTDLKIYTFVSKLSDIERALRQYYRRGEQATGEKFSAPAETGELDEKLTFSSFIEDETNSLALSFARSFVESEDIDLLIISGEHGVGKTHLLHAIGNALKGQGKTVKFTSLAEFALISEEWTRRGNPLGFLHEFGSQVLLFDGLESLSGKRGAQLILTILIDMKQTNKRKIAFTSICPPKNADFLDPKLRTRLAEAVVAQIQPPGASLKKRFLTKALGELKLPPEVEDVIIRNTSGNLRELISIAKQLRVLSKEGKKEITLGVAEQILSNFR